jgi:hypothetical protein
MMCARVTETFAELERVLSLTEVAVSVTVAGVGAVAGAVYVTAAPEALELLDRAPHAAPEQPAPDRLQVTPLFCASFVKVAMNFWLPNPTCTLAVCGETTTVIVDATVNTVLPVIVPDAA